MDRKEAQTLTGKQVMVDEQQDGIYYGELLEVVTEPRKPWRGIVKINGIDSLPKQHYTSEQFKIRKPLYDNGQVIEVIGSKISKSECADVHYNESLRQAIQKEINEATNEQSDLVIEILTAYLNTLSSETTHSFNGTSANVVQSYQFLLQELEQPSFDALEKSMTTYGVCHENIWQCHNSLEKQMQNGNRDDFRGVNFLMYKSESTVLVVQHHYERTAKHGAQEIRFDRFEMTTDTGVRSIMSYTNEFTKDR
ncbi:DUF2777 family protein [Alkalihalobacillus sp. LMS39]|uniref:DUF2777 family protein n=1 Tax=Alkalihalobacillus sp. LMS39 TaxID=2924032 RepID=UPI001FB36ACC|nr:DUF2777 family protein [Alkalihalobacillus sp. LMS39]UOE92274.1 DUF2777 domain-containing protein [Alkalihalobacillus sp. LMS39]